MSKKIYHLINMLRILI